MRTSDSKSILLAGNWQWDIYEDALSRGFKHHGWKVISFKLTDYLPKLLYSDYLIRSRCTTILSYLNKSLLKAVASYMPDAVFLNRSDLILPITLNRIKSVKPDCILFLYHNDNPFVGGLFKKFSMRHFLGSIPAADVTLVYRPSNIRDAERYGAKRVELFLPYYLSYRHRPMPVTQGCDVIFIGHYEPDGRAEVLDYLLKNEVNLKIYGPRWGTAQKKYNRLAKMDIPEKVWGEEYTTLISSAKMALVFLSVRNQDGYTRRCFEIPACRTMMIAPKTPELEQFFTDGKEAVYYHSSEDLLKKIRYYLSNDDERLHIAKAGFDRCIRDGHDETARSGQLIKIIEDIGKTQGD